MAKIFCFLLMSLVLTPAFGITESEEAVKAKSGSQFLESDNKPGSVPMSGPAVFAAQQAKVTAEPLEPQEKGLKINDNVPSPADTNKAKKQEEKEAAVRRATWWGAAVGSVVLGALGFMGAGPPGAVAAGIAGAAVGSQIGASLARHLI